MKQNKYLLPFTLIAVILVLDQVLKIWIKTHLQLGEEIPLIGNWCKLLFVENEGMAFGMAFGGRVGKLLLTLFRMVASVAVMWFMLRLIKKGVRQFYVICMALIFVGAVGNLVDSCFYGLIFNDSYYQVAELFPDGGGYGELLCGKVVDMFYLPIIDTTLPESFPIWGGKHVIFFNAIFNIADIAITISVFALLIDQIFGNRKDLESVISEKN